MIVMDFYLLFQEPNNLTNLSSLRYNGLVHKKTVGIVPADKKGFTVVLKTKKNQVCNAENSSYAKCVLFNDVFITTESLMRTIFITHDT